MTRQEFESRQRSYRRLLLMWGVVGILGLSLVLFVTFVLLGAARALASEWVFYPIALAAVVMDLVLIQSYFRLLFRLPVKRGMVCENCGKGLLSGRNRDLPSTGECGYCGAAVLNRDTGSQP